MSLYDDLRIVAIVPCKDEEAAVAKVVGDLFAAVPTIEVVVYDNCSTDQTAQRALDAGAAVRYETRAGKGKVIRRAFADLDADVYVLIDGDDTYDAAAVPRMLETLVEGPYDHVLGVRAPEESAANAYRPNHEWGNRALNQIVGVAFGNNVGDMLSGFRVFSRRFVKSFPAVSREFEIETELTVHSLALRLPAASVPVGFRDRAKGSESKLKTYRDGRKILTLIINLVRHERPLLFYGLFAALMSLVAVALSAPIVATFLRTGLVPRLPTLLAAIAVLGLGCIAIAVGLVLDGIRKSRHEVSRLAYLQIAPIAHVGAEPRIQPDNAVVLPRQRRQPVEPSDTHRAWTA